MQLEINPSDGGAEVDILNLKKMLNETTLESVEIVSGQIIEEPVVAKIVSISGGNIKSMILARTINISGSNAVIGKGGMLVCGRIFHDCSHSVNGGIVLAGKEFYKLGKNCCNYIDGASYSYFMVLGEG